MNDWWMNVFFYFFYDVLMLYVFGLKWNLKNIDIVGLKWNSVLIIIV